MMKKTILIAIATTLLCSCNKELDETGNITLPERPISIYTAIQSEKTPTVSPQTRAPITGTDAVLEGITFYLWQSTSSTTIDPTSITPSPYTGNRAKNTGAITFTSTLKPVYDKEENKHALLVGCWPATTTIAANSLTWDIDGKTDILISDLWCAGTYLAPINGTESANGETPLTFKHRLAQLEVFCKAAEGETLTDVQATWGKIKSIELLDAYPQMTYDATTNEITCTGSKKEISLLQSDYETAFTAADIQAYAATPPEAAAVATAAGMYAPASLIVLRITTEISKTVNNTTTTENLIRTFAIQFVDESNNNVGFVAGKKHTVNILFPSTIKYPQIEITPPDDWTTNSETPEDGLGGSQGVDTEGPGDWDKNDPNNDGNPVEDNLGKETTPTT